MSTPMTLLALKQEVEACGFSDTQFGAGRLVQYLNDGYGRACRMVDFWEGEATQDFSTVAGTASYPQPANLGRDRSLRFTGTSQFGELQSVRLRTIDRAMAQSGVPRAYAIDGANLHLWPTPDSVYTLELRYWALPSPLVADTDTPSLPSDFHDLLVYWALKRGYAAEDDPATAQYWEQQWTARLREFAADAKFQSSDEPSRIADYWTGPPQLSQGSWTRR